MHGGNRGRGRKGLCQNLTDGGTYIFDQEKLVFSQVNTSIASFFTTTFILFVPIDSDRKKSKLLPSTIAKIRITP